MRESAKKSLKTHKSQLNSLFLAYDNDLRLKTLQHNNIYPIVFCAKIRAKQTKFDLIYA